MDSRFTRSTQEESTNPVQSSVPTQWNQVLTALGQQHDKQQFVQLYEYFAPKVKAYLLRFTSVDAQAEELAQETLLQVWRKAHLYDASKAAASTWIFCLARNIWIDLQRSAKNRIEQNLDFYDDLSLLQEQQTVQDSDAVEGPDDANQAQRSKHQVAELLRSLPTLQAQLVYKSYFESKSHSEIAADMDIPIGSVKSGLRLAFKKLQQSLGA